MGARFDRLVDGWAHTNVGRSEASLLLTVGNIVGISGSGAMLRFVALPRNCDLHVNVPVPMLHLRLL